MLRMPKFKGINPTSVSEAVAAIAQNEDARFIAGGTDINPNLKHRLLDPKHLIALNGVEEMFGISQSDSGLRIGAMESLTHVETNDLIQPRVGRFPGFFAKLKGSQEARQPRLAGNVEPRLNA